MTDRLEPRDVFRALTARARQALVPELTGTWQFDLGSAGTWTMMADHGSVNVSQGPSGRQADVHVQISEKELDRIARGSGHENAFTALLRGTLCVQGNLRIAHQLLVLFPLPEETWRNGA